MVLFGSLHLSGPFFFAENKIQWASWLVKEGKSVSQSGYVSPAFHDDKNVGICTLLFTLPNVS